MTQRQLVLLDSIALVNATHAGTVIVSGSHGGLSASHFVTAQTHKPYAVAFNDAGGGKDDAGRVALRELQAVVCWPFCMRTLRPALARHKTGWTTAWSTA